MKKKNIVWMVVCVSVFILMLSTRRVFFKAKAYVNHGSGMMAVEEGVLMLRKYAEWHGTFPSRGADLNNLGEFSISGESKQKLEYGGDATLTLLSPERIIVLKYKYPISTDDRGPEFYCALLSGEVIVLHEKDAILGTVCPPGTEEWGFLAGKEKLHRKRTTIQTNQSIRDAKN